MNMKSSVVIGLLGSTLDAGRMQDRWQSWRPTVAICRQPDFVVKRLELLHGIRDKSLARRVADDIAAVSPGTTRCRVLSEGRDRNEKHRLQSIDGSYRASRRRHPRSSASHGAYRRWQIETCPSHLRAEKTAACCYRRFHRCELRDAAG